MSGKTVYDKLWDSHLLRKMKMVLHLFILIGIFCTK